MGAVPVFVRGPPGGRRVSRTITDVIFVRWTRIPLEGQYPPGVIDMFFSADDPHGFRYYDRLSDSGWDEERILADYEIEHRIYSIPRFTAGPSPGSASTPQPRCSWMTSRPMWRRPGDWG